jgi:hypothetical protein
MDLPPGWKGGAQSTRFFFEKKKQKTFIHLAAQSRAASAAK